MIENRKALLRLLNSIIAGNDIMAGVHFLYITVDSRQIVLLGGEIALGLAHDETNKDKA